ncbi:MAG: CpaF family protein [Actinobacteria bacterium]|nr:CpaF family protein [Actinomycetota bacterium]
MHQTDTLQVFKNKKVNMENEKVYESIGKKIAGDVEIKDLLPLSPSKRIERIYSVLKKMIDNEKIVISDKKIAKIVREIYEDTFEFGPISMLMNEDSVTEVMINDWNDIYVEVMGSLKKVDTTFRNSQHLRNMVEKIISPLGLRADESFPMVDARLKDGSRINIVLSPVSSKELVVTIRKFRKSLIGINDLLLEDSLDEKIADFLKACVNSRVNIILSGATSTGKTTLLNIISGLIPQNERIITIEDTFELNLKLAHVIRLESRPANLEGKGEITLRDLVKNSLRMRPDRIVVGEIRGPEAVDVLQAMNTGHEGSMTTVHANSPVDLISRLETMLLMSGINLTPPSARRIIASSVDCIIHLERLNNGQRVISRVSEIINSSSRIGNSATLEVMDIFILENKDTKRDFIFTGYIPGFISKINKRGEEFDFKNL